MTLRPRVVLVAAGGGFAALAVGVLALGALPADAAVRLALLAIASPPLVAAMRVVNHAGSWLVLGPAMLVVLAALDRARERWWVWVGLMLAAPAAEGVVKALVARPRPEDASFGFPSGHATAAAAFFGALIYLVGPLPAPARRALRALAVTMIVLVGLARVILRAHWPSDVLGGFALGLALAAAAAMVARERRPSGPAP